MADRRALAFLGLTFLFSWGIVFGAYHAGWAGDDVKTFVTLVLMMAGPAVAAVACALLFEKGRRLESLGLQWSPNTWWIGAWLAAILLSAASVAITIGLGGRGLADIGQNATAAAKAMVEARAPGTGQDIPTQSSETLLVMSIFAGALANSIALTFTEELGWRGYLHGVWREAGFWPTSLLTGLIWGIWHGPAIILFGHNGYCDFAWQGFGLFTLFCIALSPVMAFVRDRGRSVIAAGILHGTLNATGALTIFALSDSTFPWGGIAGIGGVLGAAVLAAILACAPKAKT